MPKYSIINFNAFCIFTLSGIMLAISPGTAAADRAWRCVQSTCPDSQLNDIEDAIEQRWPSSLELFMPPISATCARRLDDCPHCIAGPRRGGSISTSTIPWSLVFSGDLKSFLIGRYIADARISGSIKVIALPPEKTILTSVSRRTMHVTEDSWNGTTMAYSFDPSTDEIPAIGGTTGVQDLGAINFKVSSGVFWNASLRVTINMAYYQWCEVGSERFEGTGEHVFNLPVGFTPVEKILGEAIRNQFRRAVRLTVAGRTESSISEFDEWARAPHVRAVSGDFNGDERTDIALVGGDQWPMIPVAFSNGDGSFSVTATAVSDFPSWTSLPGVQVVAADVNGDGRADLVAAGGPGWTTIPVALSNGDGSFTVLNKPNAQFSTWSTIAGATLLAGYVNSDARVDLLLVGGVGWNTIPVAFSNGDGTFAVTNMAVDSFPFWAQTANAKPLVAGIRGGHADVILTGANWSTVPMALSQGDGTFSTVNKTEPSISAWSQSPGAKVLSGDVNGDSREDLLLTGGTGWWTIPVGLSNGDGTFIVKNPVVPDFSAWSQDSAAQAVSGDFNGDGLTDVALVGGTGWWTTPVAFSNGDATFHVTNAPVP